MSKPSDSYRMRRSWTQQAHHHGSSAGVYLVGPLLRINRTVAGSWQITPQALRGDARAQEALDWLTRHDLLHRQFPNRRDAYRSLLAAAAQQPPPRYPQLSR